MSADEVPISMKDRMVKASVLVRIISGKVMSIATKKHDQYIVNKCNPCNAEYYSIVRIDTHSALSNIVTVYRCPHALDIKAFVIFI